jgi:hypothetical protein
MVEGRFADETVWPHMLQQLLFGDDAVVVPDEVQQDVEHLWLKWAWELLVAEFVELRVECIISEQVQHSHYPSAS